MDQVAPAAAPACRHGRGGGRGSGQALARQLREYKRFKEIAAALKELEERGLHTFPRVAPPPELEKRLEADAGLLDDLLAAARLALHDAPPTAGPEIPGGLVVPFTLTIADQMNHIRRTALENRRVTFRDLLTNAPHRIEIIVTLLAILELIKRGQVQVVQEEAFGEIMIEGLGSVGAELDESDADDPDGRPGVHPVRLLMRSTRCRYTHRAKAAPAASVRMSSMSGLRPGTKCWWKSSARP